MDREALLAAEPVLADLDRYLRKLNPTMPQLAALATVRRALAHCPRCGKPHGGPGHIHTCTPKPPAPQPQPSCYKHDEPKRGCAWWDKQQAPQSAQGEKQ